MIKLALIGYPLGHSLSPAMHEAALGELGLEGDYTLFETPAEQIADRVEFFKSNDFRGFNVTIPHKVKIMKFLDDIDGFAQKIGAVNTVVISRDKKLSGYNTDVYGFMQAIPQKSRESFRGKKAVIIGSGGAARAVGAGIAEMGFSELDIITLPSEIFNAGEIKTLLNKNYPYLKIEYVKLEEKVGLSGVSLVVNATPVGMEGKFQGQSPLSEYSLDSLPPETFVYDIVYKPQKTKLLELAENRGFKTLCGLDMLVLQGAKGFSLWTEKDAPVEIMKSALLQNI